MGIESAAGAGSAALALLPVHAVEQSIAPASNTDDKSFILVIIRCLYSYFKSAHCCEAGHGVATIDNVAGGGDIVEDTK